MHHCRRPVIPVRGHSVLAPFIAFRTVLGLEHVAHSVDSNFLNFNRCIVCQFAWSSLEFQNFYNLFLLKANIINIDLPENFIFITISLLITGLLFWWSLLYTNSRLCWDSKDKEIWILSWLISHFEIKRNQLFGHWYKIRWYHWMPSCFIITILPNFWIACVTIIYFRAKNIQG